MSREPHAEGQYLDLHAQQHADKSFLGGSGVSSRAGLFFFIGVLAVGAFAGLYYYVDQRMARSLSAWNDAQRIAGSVSELSRAIDDVRVYDRRVRDNRDATSAQAHRRAIDRVAVALDSIQGSPHALDLRDSMITTRDAFAEYGVEFSAMIENQTVLGVSENTGLRAQLGDAADNVRDTLTANELDALIADFEVINALAEQEIAADDAAGGDRGYDALNGLIARSLVDDTIKAQLGELLVRHGNVLDALLDTRARLGLVPQSFDDILDYVGPSLRALSDFSAQFGRAAPAAFERERQMMRRLIAGGSAGIVLSLILAGIVLIRSLSSPMRKLADATAHLVDGDHTAVVPLRGNTNELGNMARALDIWLDNLVELDHLRTELDDLRMRSALGAIAEAVDTTDAALEGEDHEDAPVTPQPGLPPEISAAQLIERSAVAQNSSIGSASKQLSQYSDYVTAAARDVERTETLIRVLADASHDISELETCVAGVRDEANLLVFRAPNRPGPGDDRDTLVYLKDERGDTPGTAAGGVPDGRRFDAIRETVARAERLVSSVRTSLDKVSEVAQEIASTASVEALEATNKLLSQSEYLQNMLDDLVQKMGPVAGENTSRPMMKPLKHNADSED